MLLYIKDKTNLFSLIKHNHEEDGLKCEKIITLNLIEKRNIKTKEKVEDIIINIINDVSEYTIAHMPNIHK